ncbi:MAG: RICIN domain-containing protein [Eubacteriales bacterium]
MNSTSISISKSTDHATVNSTIQLTATTAPSGKAVTWESSNIDVASVSSSGLVTINRLGSAIITGTLTDGKAASVTIYGVLADGIYILRNAGSHTVTTVDSLHLFSNTYPYLYNSNSTSLNQYWRIAYMDTGRYVIYPYMNYNQKLSYNSTNGVYLSTANVNATMLWEITDESYQRSIRNCLSGKMLATETYPANYDRLSMETYNSSSSASTQRWLITKVSAPASGIFWQASDSEYTYSSTSTSKTIEIGDTITYSLMYYSETVPSQNFTWASGSTSVAKVSNGKITAIGQGTTTITANHSSGSNLTIPVTVVPLPLGPDSGVYSIQKVGTTSYMYSSDTHGEHMVLQTISAKSPKSDDNRTALFKLVYRPTTQDYIIRSMMNNEVIIYANPTYYYDGHRGYPRTRLESGASDANISTDYTWRITPVDENSYYIWYRQIGGTTKYYLTMLEPDMLILTTSVNSATKWVLSKYTGTLKGIDLNTIDSHIIESGSSIDLSSLATDSAYYSSIIGDNTPGTATFSVSDLSGDLTSIATISNSGMLSTVSQKIGVAKVTVSFSKGVSLSVNYYINPVNGEYFFMQNIQKTTGYVDGNSSGAIKKDFTYDDTQLWQRIPASSGYYYIKNVGTGLYLKSPVSTSENTPIEMSSTTTSDLCEWSFTSTSAGAWKIRCKNDVVNDRNLYLCIKTNTNDTLVQGKHIVNSSYFDEFNIITIGGDVVYLKTVLKRATIDPSDTISSLSKYYSSFSLLHNQIQVNQNQAINMIQNSKIMIIHGHASPTSITINEPIWGHLDNNTIYYLSNPSLSLDLSKIDIVIFAGCSSGGNICNGDKESPSFCCPTYDSNGNIHNCNKLGCICCANSFNLPKSAELAGAKVAIGWHVMQWDNNNDDWINMFFSLMNTIKPETGKLYTAKEALEETNLNMVNYDNDKAVLFGTDPNFRLGT